MSDIITIGIDNAGSFYHSQVWGELSEQEYINYLNNLRQAGHVYRINPAERISSEVIRSTIIVR